MIAIPRDLRQNLIDLVNESWNTIYFSLKITSEISDFIETDNLTSVFDFSKLKNYELKFYNDIEAERIEIQYKRTNKIGKEFEIKFTLTTIEVQKISKNLIEISKLFAIDDGIATYFSHKKHVHLYYIFIIDLYKKKRIFVNNTSRIIIDNVDYISKVIDKKGNYPWFKNAHEIERLFLKESNPHVFSILS